MNHHKSTSFEPQFWMLFLFSFSIGHIASDSCQPVRLHSFDALADSWWCHRIAEDQQVEASLKLPRAGEGIGSQSEKGQQLTVGNNLGERDTQSEDESEQAFSQLGLSKSRKRIVVRRQMRNRKVHCPKGKICELVSLVCKGNGACSSLKGCTGQWSKLTCTE